MVALKNLRKPNIELLQKEDTKARVKSVGICSTHVVLVLNNIAIVICILVCAHCLVQFATGLLAYKEH